MMMYFYWGCDCTFLFKVLTTEVGEYGKFILACLAVVAFCLFGPVLRNAKSHAIRKGKNDSSFTRISVMFLQLLSYIHDALMMLLIMSYNWVVVFSVIIGYTLGYTIFNLEEEYQDPTKENFADCC